MNHKREFCESLLEKGWVFVHLDPRIEAVDVPHWLRQQPQLTLQIGYGMPVPIGDLQVDAKGISGSLSFNRHPYHCKLPWESIFALVNSADDTGQVWPESMPFEVAEEAKQSGAKVLKLKIHSKKVRPSSIEKAAQKIEDKKVKPRPSYLRLVK